MWGGNRSQYLKSEWLRWCGVSQTQKVLFNCYFKCGGVWREFLFSKFIPDLWQFFYMVSSRKGNIKVISIPEVKKWSANWVPLNLRTIGKGVPYSLILFCFENFASFRFNLFVLLHFFEFNLTPQFLQHPPTTLKHHSHNTHKPLRHHSLEELRKKSAK